MHKSVYWLALDILCTRSCGNELISALPPNIVRLALSYDFIFADMR